MKIGVLNCIKNAESLLTRVLWCSGAGRAVQGYLAEQQSLPGVFQESRFRLLWHWKARVFKIVSGCAPAAERSG